MSLSDAPDRLKQAYQSTLDFLGWRQQSYQLKFPNRAQDIVLKDILRACHVNEECPYTDPFKVGEWLGMQKIGLRICRHLEFTVEELFDCYSGIRQQKEN